MTRRASLTAPSTASLAAVQEEERADVARGDHRQALREVDGRLVAEDTAAVHHPLHLRQGGGHHTRVVVPDVRRRRAGREVEVAAPVGRLDP